MYNTKDHATIRPKYPHERCLAVLNAFRAICVKKIDSQLMGQSSYFNSFSNFPFVNNNISGNDIRKVESYQSIVQILTNKNLGVDIVLIIELSHLQIYQNHILSDLYNSYEYP